MRKTTILFVDNDAAFLATRSDYLRHEGYRIIRCNEPTRALRIAAGRKIDLVILDVRLQDDQDEQDESGLDLAEKIAALHIPTIILTGFPIDQLITKIFRMLNNQSTVPLDLVGKAEDCATLFL